MGEAKYIYFTCLNEERDGSLKILGSLEIGET